MVREVASSPGLTRDAQEMAALLADLGVDQREAKILAYLADAKEAKSAQIERVWKMRQPEVSIATKGLRERGWLTAAEQKSLGRGRPVNVYRLERPLPEIVDSVEERRRREADSEAAKLARLRSLLGGRNGRNGHRE